jgi:hypothetical protein
LYLKGLRGFPVLTTLGGAVGEAGKLKRNDGNKREETRKSKGGEGGLRR